MPTLEESFGQKYNTRSAGVKRLMRETIELREPTELFAAQPLEDNLFEWHFSVRGPSDSEFAGGVYHGRMLFPAEYPMKPPNLMILTPNGRFELNKKICLSISGYHPETWLPSWSIRTALLALVGFMPTHSGGAIGALDYPADERKRLARDSVWWKCRECGACMGDALRPLEEGAGGEQEQEARQLATQLNFKDEAAQKAAVAAAGGEAPVGDAVPSAPAAPVPVAVVEQPSPTREEQTMEMDHLAAGDSIAAQAAVREALTAEATAPPAAPARPAPRSSAPRREPVPQSMFWAVSLGVVFVSVFMVLFARRFLLKM